MRYMLLACLLFLGSAGALAAAEGACPDGGQALSEQLARLRGLSANFEQRITAADGHPLQTSAGVLQLAKPGRIYWVAEPPYEQTVVADGSNIWVYDPDLEQVTVKALHRQLDNSPAALLVGDARQVLKEFRVCAFEEGKTSRILLRPLSTDSVYTEVELDFADGAPSAIRMQDSLGQRTVVELRDVELNPVLNPAVFHFVPPPGVDVFRDD
ncbi:MAG: outer membrane lipoprotein chaperone LolA [Pseudomonadales bacterium]|nr:outer membrane lipoprotein chaperone LolA [Pseudomonadales bacterium]